MKFLQTRIFITILSLVIFNLITAEEFNHNGETNNGKKICEQPKEIGRCRAAFPRFYFNKATKSCEAFTWGGCDANENNFKTIEECLQTCMPKPKEDEKCNVFQACWWL